MIVRLEKYGQQYVIIVEGQSFYVDDVYIDDARFDDDGTVFIDAFLIEMRNRTVHIRTLAGTLKYSLDTIIDILSAS